MLIITTFAAVSLIDVLPFDRLDWQLFCYRFCWNISGLCDCYSIRGTAIIIFLKSLLRILFKNYLSCGKSKVLLFKATNYGFQLNHTMDWIARFRTWPLSPTALIMTHVKHVSWSGLVHDKPSVPAGTSLQCNVSGYKGLASCLSVPRGWLGVLTKLTILQGGSFYIPWRSIIWFVTLSRYAH